ncbi:MAG: ATP-dependent Clp protease ATP-binding subunit ClpX [Kiritimatiellae bacterium]|nr:ATP-dependent Clp protease ATP-binding subunit ClpX [Kiritimatiellia bacterium]
MPPRKKNTSKDKRFCMACGAQEPETNILVFDEGFSLCEECVAANADKLRNMFPEFRDDIQKAISRVNAKYSAPHQNKKDPEVKSFTVNVPPPAEIKAFLDQYVVGQEGAKKALAVAVHNHYRRINPVESEKKFKELEDVEIEKSNILLMGPTGSGKTLLARTLARMLDVPFAIADATTLTEAGYVGEDVENILLNLIQAAGMDLERAKNGIIFVDEIDKIGRRTENVSVTRDVSGEGVQQALLKILEGTIARVPPAGGRKHPEQKYLELDTTNILFICGGAFVGLQDIVSKRYAKKHFGFSAEADTNSNNAQKKDAILRPDPEDLVKYGMIPEFVGRLPVVAMLNELTEDDLVHILTTPKNCIVKQYRKLLALDGIDIEFTDGAVRAIAKEALTRKTGARGLRAIMEDLMIDVMYNIGDYAKQKKLVITEEHVIAQLKEPGVLVELLKKGK